MYQDSDIGFELGHAPAVVSSTTVDSEVVGEIFDRQGKNFPGSALLIINFSAALAEAETLKVTAVDVDHGAASNLSDAAQYNNLFSTILGSVAPTLATGPAGGGTVKGSYGIRVPNLRGAKRYVRPQITLTTSGAGTCTWSASLALGGFAQQPQVP